MCGAPCAAAGLEALGKVSNSALDARPVGAQEPPSPGETNGLPGGFPEQVTSRTLKVGVCIDSVSHGTGQWTTRP